MRSQICDSYTSHKGADEAEPMWLHKGARKQTESAEETSWDKRFTPFFCYIWPNHVFDSSLSSSGLLHSLKPTSCRRTAASVLCLISRSLSPYVGQSVCIDIFSVYGSPESRIGDHPRNRLSHFNALWKWSSHVVSSISRFIAGSPPFTPPSEEKPSRAVIQHRKLVCVTSLTVTQLWDGGVGWGRAGIASVIYSIMLLCVSENKSLCSHVARKNSALQVSSVLTLPSPQNYHQ